MRRYGVLEVSQQVLGVAKVSIRPSLRRSVAQLFYDGQICSSTVNTEQFRIIDYNKKNSTDKNSSQAIIGTVNPPYLTWWWLENWTRESTGHD